MNIDWSKAPEGATHYSSATEMFYRRVSTAEWECHVGADHGWFSSSDWRGRTTAPGFAIARPMDATWNGEGLPPVGTVCEYGQRQHWEQVTVIAHWLNGGDLCPVAQVPNNGPICMGELKYFRPLRTAEQIEAEERKNSIYEMAGHSHVGRSGFAMDMCAALYDAGYRKCP